MPLFFDLCPMSNPGRTFTDSLNRTVNLPETPHRIISLCPSITETLIHFGLENELVGRTRFCIHPAEKLKNVERVGGTKEVHFERITDLQPDLIICEKEENTPEMVAELEKNYCVVVEDVVDLESGLRMIQNLGFCTAKEQAAANLAAEIRAAFARLHRVQRVARTLYFIWKSPWMVVGENTFIHSVLGRIGLENIGAQLEGRYPDIEEAAIPQLQPDLILLSSEPYPFKADHIAYLKKLVPNAHIQLVDGEMFTWYGSRMLLAAEYLTQFVNDLNSLNNGK